MSALCRQRDPMRKFCSLSPPGPDTGGVHDDDDELAELLARAKPLRDMVRERKPGDRWPYEPPAPDRGPEGGVREPRRPIPSAGSGAAEIEPEPEGR